MDRSTVYSGEVPRTVDVLQLQQSAMVALGVATNALLGVTNGIVTGLACTPSSGLIVSVSAGNVFQIANLEASTWSALAADTGHQILKQGINLDAQTFTITPPATGGFSQVFMIEAAYADSDTGSTVLPYYNSAVPSSPFSGPGNSGTPQNTLRKGIVNLQVKAGIAATTGTQAAPTVDAGFIALWLITVANGQVTISGGNIVQVANAPFLGAAYMPKLSTMANYIQSGAWGVCTDTGAANSVTVAPSPPPVSIGLGTKLTVKVLNSLTGASTLAVTLANGSVNTSPIVRGDLTATQNADILASQLVELNYDGANWQLPRPPTSVTAQSLQASALGINAPINCAIAATVSGNALTVTVKSQSGNLSTTNPLLVTFRASTGVQFVRNITSNLTFTVSAGNTLGALNNAGTNTNVTPRFRVVIIDNSGTQYVGLINCLLLGASNAVQIFPLNENSFPTTGAGTGGGNSAGVIYTSAASLTGCNIREIGYLEYTTPIATSGTYVNAPDVIALGGVGYKKAGDLVQSASMSSASNTSNSTTTFAVSTLTQSMAPTSPANVLRISAYGGYTTLSQNVFGVIQAQRGATAIGQPLTAGWGATIAGLGYSGGDFPFSFVTYDAPQTNASTAYAIYFKATTAALVVNIAQGGITVEEISA